MWAFMKILLCGFVVSSVLSVGSVSASAKQRVAIFVQNRAGSDFDREVPVLEDMVASRVSSQGFQILSRTIILDTLKQYPPGKGADGGESAGQKMDRLLNESTSALRLAQNLGADYILLTTIASFGTDERAYTGNDVTTDTYRGTLRLTYRLAETARGGEVAGDTVRASGTLRKSAGLQITSTDFRNALLEKAAADLAQRLIARRGDLPTVDPDSRLVNVAIACTVTDFRTLPNAGLNEHNEVVLGSGYADAYALNVVVELDGIVLGNAPGEFNIAPGLHKLRLTREGFKPFARTINAFDGQTLTVPMQMSEEGFARWKDVVATLTGLENNRKLTDAEVKVLEGYAKMFRQSGIKVDTQEGLNFYRGLYW